MMKNEKFSMKLKIINKFTSKFKLSILCFFYFSVGPLENVIFWTKKKDNTGLQKTVLAQV